MKYFNVILYILNTNTGREVQYNENVLAASEADAIDKLRKKHSLYYESDNAEPDVELLPYYMKKGDITWYQVNNIRYEGINSKGKFVYYVERNPDFRWELYEDIKLLDSSSYRNDLMDSIKLKVA